MNETLNIYIFLRCLIVLLFSAFPNVEFPKCSNFLLSEFDWRIYETGFSSSAVWPLVKIVALP